MLMMMMAMFLTLFLFFAVGWGEVGVGWGGGGDVQALLQEPCGCFEQVCLCVCARALARALVCLREIA